MNSGNCPNDIVIDPCVCSRDNIKCTGNQDFDLKAVFYELSDKLNNNEKHFRSFALINSAFTELKAETFKDITFDEISIYKCFRLDRIHPTAFASTYNYTKVITFEWNPKLRLIGNLLYKILSNFRNIENITLINNGENLDIPSNVFHNNDVLNYSLKYLIIKVHSLKLDEYAFSSLNNLEYIEIDSPNFDYISENAFNFSAASNKLLNINLFTNYYNFGSLFTKNSLTNLKRPTIISFTSFSEKTIEYLPENVFLPFFKSNHKNKINLNKTPIDCMNCGNEWLTQYPQYLRGTDQKLFDSKCSNGNSIGVKYFMHCNKNLNKLLKPCSHSENTVICGGNEEIDLKSIFFTLSNGLEKHKKHFPKLILNNAVIKELKENTFNDIIFDSIEINGCLNLTTINENSFNGTDIEVKELILKNNPRLSSRRSLRFRRVVIIIFESGRFKNLRKFYSLNNDISVIGEHIFGPLHGVPNKLTELRFEGKSLK